jgi:DNA-binding transcriptional LysR family regulator
MDGRPGVTLEQARALDALARHGTFARAAAALNKRHTAVLYALKTLEEQSGVVLLDRRGYRTRLTPGGTRVLEHARKLLSAARELEDACAEIRTGWEPELRLVFDGIFPVEPILEVALAIARAGATTRVDVSTEFLAGVERTFVDADADLMVTVITPQATDLRVVRLAPIRARLLAHRDHPLARVRGDIEPSDLAAHLLLTVRGSDPRLHLSTGDIEPTITFRLNDFHAKKAGLLAGLGYGWMPEHLVENELKKRVLVPLRWRGAEVHVFEPRLYYRGGRPLGRAARLVVDRLKADARRTRAG